MNYVPTTEELNALQGASVISDNCVTRDEVAEIDRVRAMTWLEERRQAAEE